MITSFFEMFQRHRVLDPFTSIRLLQVFSLSLKQAQINISVVQPTTMSAGEYVAMQERYQT